MANEDDRTAEGRRIVAKSALLWGGASIWPDGQTEPIPEADTLAVAIGAWVNYPDTLDDAVRIYLSVINRSEPPVRRAVLDAVEAIAHRYQRVPQRGAVMDAARGAVSDQDPGVCAAAARALRALEALLPD